MKSTMLLLTLMLLCAGCSTVHSDAGTKVDNLIVPAVKQYTKTQQSQAAKEMKDHCNVTPMLCQMAIDFGRMRDQARVALGLKVDINR